MQIKFLLLIGCALFLPTIFLNIIPFPLFNAHESGYGRPCYSPNHKFYIERYTTLPKAVFITPSQSKSGFAILYDETGKEIYRGHANDIYKPRWSEESVSFFGGWGVNGYDGAKLPSSPGNELIALGNLPIGCGFIENQNK